MSEFLDKEKFKKSSLKNVFPVFSVAQAIVCGSMTYAKASVRDHSTRV